MKSAEENSEVGKKEGSVARICLVLLQKCSKVAFPERYSAHCFHLKDGFICCLS